MDWRPWRWSRDDLEFVIAVVSLVATGWTFAVARGARRAANEAAQIQKERIGRARLLSELQQVDLIRAHLRSAIQAEEAGGIDQALGRWTSLAGRLTGLLRAADIEPGVRSRVSDRLSDLATALKLAAEGDGGASLDTYGPVFEKFDRLVETSVGDQRKSRFRINESRGPGVGVFLGR
jgi:hypothetical protein